VVQTAHLCRPVFSVGSGIDIVSQYLRLCALLM